MDCIEGLQRKIKSVATTAFIVIFSNHCFAESPQEITDYLGVTEIYSPKFSGADSYHFLTLPALRIKYGALKIEGHTGISYDLFTQDDLTAGVVAGYFFGRDDSDADYLDGMGDIDDAITLGIYAQQKFKYFKLSSNVKRDFSVDVGGVTANFSTSFSFMATNRLLITPSAKVSWMDDTYAQAIYGVTQTQANNSSLAKTTASGGIEKVSLSSTAVFFITRQIAFSTTVGVSKLLGDAQSSPITHESYPVSVVSSLSYNF